MDKTYWIPEGEGAQSQGAQVETLLRLIGDDFYVESLKLVGQRALLGKATDLAVDGGELTGTDHLRVCSALRKVGVAL